MADEALEPHKPLGTAESLKEYLDEATGYAVVEQNGNIYLKNSLTQKLEARFDEEKLSWIYPDETPLEPAAERAPLDALATDPYAVSSALRSASLQELPKKVAIRARSGSGFARGASREDSARVFTAPSSFPGLELSNQLRSTHSQAAHTEPTQREVSQSSVEPPAGQQLLTRESAVQAAPYVPSGRASRLRELLREEERGAIKLFNVRPDAVLLGDAPPSRAAYERCLSKLRHRHEILLDSLKQIHAICKSIIHINCRHEHMSFEDQILTSVAITLLQVFDPEGAAPSSNTSLFNKRISSILRDGDAQSIELSSAIQSRVKDLLSEGVQASIEQLVKVSARGTSPKDRCIHSISSAFINLLNFSKQRLQY